MSETLLIWLFAGAFGLLGVLFLLWYQHSMRCKGISEKQGEDIAVIKQMLTDIRSEIGDHEKGMIGQLHRYSKSIVKINTKLGIDE